MTNVDWSINVRDIYQRHAAAFDEQRAKILFEKAWLDQFLARASAEAAILDVGCGSGDPIAAYFLAQGRAVTGVDAASAMLAIALDRFPQARWIEADMRTLDLGETFGGVLAWDSFFHLNANDQRDCLPRLCAHVAPGGAMMLTVGPDRGDVIGHVDGAPVPHASLSPAEYAKLFEREGMRLTDFKADDDACDGHTVLIAVRG